MSENERPARSSSSAPSPPKPFYMIEQRTFDEYHQFKDVRGGKWLIVPFRPTLPWQSFTDDPHQATRFASREVAERVMRIELSGNDPEGYVQRYGAFVSEHLWMESAGDLPQGRLVTPYRPDSSSDAPAPEPTTALHDSHEGADPAAIGDLRCENCGVGASASPNVASQPCTRPSTDVMSHRVRRPAPAANNSPEILMDSPVVKIGPAPAATPPTREMLPWEIRVPRSAVVGDVMSESCRVYVEDGQHWMEERDGSSTPLIILRADRVRIVDDAATNLAESPLSEAPIPEPSPLTPRTALIAEAPGKET